MSFHFNFFSISLMMSGVATLLVAFLTLYRSAQIVKSFAALMFCVAIWAIAYSFELSSRSLDHMLAWISVEYIGIAFLPSMWIFFIVRFVGKSDWLNVPTLITILAFPTATLLLVWTNSWHHIHYKEVWMDSSGPFPMLSISPGLWYHVHTVYFYFMLALGTGILVIRFRHASTSFKRQSQIILLGACLPWLVNFIYLIGIRPFHHIDLTPYAFIVTSISIGYGLYRYRLFNIIPLAREKVVEAIQEGIIVLDNQGRIIDMNYAMRAFLPAYLTDVIGETLVDILPEQVQLHQLVGEEINNRTEIEINGRFYDVAVTQLNDKKYSSGAILIFWDITERKNAVQRIEDHAEQLQEINHVKDKLFSIVAHDLRSPIASLTTLLTMVEDSQITGEEFKTIVTTLSRNVSYTSVMLENLLYWSMSQMKGYSVQPKKFRLKAMVADKFKLFEKQAIDKKITLYNNVTEGIALYADTDMIGIILRNLVSNAIKFCRPSDAIIISARVKSHVVTVCVQDTGIGMESQLIDKLFSMERVTTIGTEKEKGTGIGLKLCKEFVEMNKGTFHVESEVGSGSRFYFTLKGCNESDH